MTSAQGRFRRLQELCEELGPLSEAHRESRLQELEGLEPELFPELRELLETTLLAGLEGVAEDAREMVSEASVDEPTRVGRYELIRLLGVGGMGEVWAAQQSEPVERVVALKVLRRGAATPGRIARFEAERQALANMEHPNIARVFDGGATDDGQPFFVMELVDGGIPITTYCAHHELDLEARIRLFLPVCDAVDHAHRKRIIHRDLKPSNVLVTEDAGQPVVKVIDFGIAKPLEEQWASETHATVIGELVGTPEYMSPEQASLGAIDIDTRSDVFTLGLMLFELVVGELPVSSRELRKLPFDELCRRIREDDTPLASTMMRRLTRESATTARTHTGWRSVQGDLDRILAKALAKDRDQRYGSAAEFADDLRRFLAFEPVRAMPPSGVYRFRKFVRRHRAGVAAAATLLLGLVVGLAVAVVGFRQARAAEAEALANLESLEASEGFLIDLFEGATPQENLGEDPRASELLQRGLERLDRLEDRPRTQARLLYGLGEVQRQRGEYERAEELLRRSLDLLENRVDNPLMRALARTRLCALHRRAERVEEAESECRTAIDEYREHAPDHNGLGSAYNELAILLNDQRRFDDAQRIYEQLIEYLRLDEDAPALALPSVQFNLATNVADGGDPARAIELLLEPIAAFRERLPEEHPHFGTIHSTLSIWHGQTGRMACSKRHLDLSLAIDRKVLPPEHPHLADSLRGAGQYYERVGDYERAASYYDEALEIFRQALGESAPRTRGAMLYRALLDLVSGKAASAADGLAALRLSSSAELSEEGAVLTARERFYAIALRIAALGESDEEQARSRLELANRALERAQELAEQHELPAEGVGVLLQRSILAAQRGRLSESQRWLTAAEGASAALDGEHSLDDPSTYHFRAQQAGLIGNMDQAFAWAREAVRHPERSMWIVDAPEMAALSEDPRFAELRAELRRALLTDGDAPCLGLPPE